MKKKIGFTYNLKSDWQHSPNDPVDAAAELDKEATIRHVEEALGDGGHAVKRIGNAFSLLSQIKNLDVDIVLNICEGLRGRNRESEVPVILEMFGIPFIGSDGLTLGITLDKLASKKFFFAEGIPTPRYFQAKPGNNLENLNTIGFPLFVKASREGTSKGITKASLVRTPKELKEQVDIVHMLYKQPALVEEFISGTEFTVLVIGNENPEPMPVIQYMMNNTLELGDRFYTSKDVVEKSVGCICPTDIPKSLEKKLKDVSVAVYEAVDCRDFGRVDFRVDTEGNPYVLEINPLPNLGPEDVFGTFPQAAGLTYAQAINKIVDVALKRYGM
ncbi:MAG: ATP-grasp domain-containing protein [bacterium]|nr:ATP-grasp domain-containing protein [bacterium]